MSVQKVFITEEGNAVLGYFYEGADYAAYEKGNGEVKSAILYPVISLEDWEKTLISGNN